MKSVSIVFLAALIVVAMNCKPSKDHVETINIEKTIDDEVMLLGAVNRAGLQKAEYVEWFDTNYEDYEPKDSILNLLAGKMDDIAIRIFIGTWCEDSQRDIPAFYRILDKLNESPQHSIIALDRSKKRPEALVEGFDIEYIPTFILYRNDEELGRIIEIPEVTLEADILKIVSNPG